MSARPSTIPAVKAATVALFEAAIAASSLPGKGDVEVTYGRGREVLREQVILGGTVADEQSWGPLGALSRDERYDLELFVRCTRPGDTQPEATARVFAVFGVLELALRAAPTLSVAGVQTVQLAQPELTEGVFDDEGFAAVIESGLRVHARI